MKNTLGIFCAVCRTLPETLRQRLSTVRRFRWRASVASRQVPPARARWPCASTPLTWLVLPIDRDHLDPNARVQTATRERLCTRVSDPASVSSPCTTQRFCEEEEMTLVCAPRVSTRDPLGKEPPFFSMWDPRRKSDPRGDLTELAQESPSTAGGPDHRPPPLSDTSQNAAHANSTGSPSTTTAGREFLSETPAKRFSVSCQKPHTRWGAIEKRAWHILCSF